MFFGLPFLPYQMVEDGFVELVGDFPDEDRLEFSDYVLNNYIEPNCILNILYLEIFQLIYGLKNLQ